MPNKSRIETELPEEIREELNQKLIENRFTDYRGLSEWLKEKGYSIGKSNIQRYGRRVEKEIAESRERLEFAKILNQQCDDGANEVGEALNRIVQNKLFDAAQNGDFNNDEMSIAALANAAAKLNYSALAVKKFLAEERAKIAKQLEEVTEEVIENVKKAGLSEESAIDMRRKILGVVK